MIIRGLLSALIISASFCLHGVFAGAFEGSPEAVLIQAEEPQDFEDWYGPDEAYPNDDQGRPAEDEIVPEGSGDQPRTAPDEDTRPNDR